MICYSMISYTVTLYSNYTILHYITLCYIILYYIVSYYIIVYDLIATSSTPTESLEMGSSVSPQTESLAFGGFDSSRFSMLRGGVLSLRILRTPTDGTLDFQTKILPNPG